MNRSIIAALLVTIGTFSASAQSYATKIRAEVQTAGTQSLRALEWQQGSTPLIRVESLDNGRPIPADSGMTVRMIIGESATAELYAVANATTATNNYYEIQWPTIGTNTDDSAWWYTVYFEKAGHRYWTGDGELIINATTSTAQDGLEWIDVICTTNMFVPQSRTVTVNGQTGALSTNVNFTVTVTESDPIAYPISTNALAVAQAAYPRNNPSNYVNRAQATNGMQVAGAYLTAEADTLATVTARGATTTSAVTIGSRNASAVGALSFAQGDSVIASGVCSHAQGNSVIAGGTSSHAQGSNTSAGGIASHSQGSNTQASGNYSHAQGLYTIASGIVSHAAGFASTSSGFASFTWQGGAGNYEESTYTSHGSGTFNINPVGGTGGFWIGETTLAALLSAKANAETVVSGAVGTASAGNRYFWTAATNVVLRVSLTGGQVINYASIRNTATNAITATASNSGWKWTGGSMTNSIPAGKMMTFGWACNPSTGATNAYATAASAN
jgi:hypothetical protein